MMIRKTASVPVDPDEPSFLKTLPAETRNAIYRALFERDDPILLHQPAALLSKEPKRLDYTNAQDYHQAMDEYIGFCDKMFRDGQDFRHTLHEGLGVLLTCRQVYHEAASVLYGLNVFVFSRVSGLHDIDFEKYDQLLHVSKWLSNIGSQANLLKKIVIDVDTMCPWNCRDSVIDYCLLPLVQHIWSNPEMRKVITFGHSGRTSEADHLLSVSAGDDQRSPDYLSNVLHNGLLAIAVDDALGTYFPSFLSP
ncbi:hypothetical protein NX059_009416 [Plenodomus lindquistii]|nr:hypothetical protein NX059_009416 [Plenodomus lindquistii]